MTRTALLSALLISSLALPNVGSASCKVKNSTEVALSISSGHVKGQRVSAHSSTQIDDGALKGEASDGRTFTGECPDGGQIEITDDGQTLHVR